MMHILITDSGTGGLSVVAYAERFVREHGVGQPLRLTFANAAPSNESGYQAMPTKEAKVQAFDHFLRSVAGRFQPDSIYVACNTLSVLLPDTPFYREGEIPVDGIVETAARLTLQNLASRAGAVAVLFGTQTTIDAGTYARLLEERGVPPSRIVNQACPGLADVISEDREGKRSAAEIQRWVQTAAGKLPQTKVPVVAALVCTHYGYRREQFETAFRAAGIDAIVLNPNEAAVADLFPGDGGPHREAEVGFVTRYPIPPPTVEALTYFLEDISPRTVEAMQNFLHQPDLF